MDLQKYVVKYAFNLPDGFCPAGYELSQEQYEEACRLGFSDRMSLVGAMPASLKSDEELKEDLLQLLVEFDNRGITAKVNFNEEVFAEEEDHNNDQDQNSDNSEEENIQEVLPKTETRGRKPNFSK